MYPEKYFSSLGFAKSAHRGENIQNYIAKCKLNIYWGGVK